MPPTIDISFDFIEITVTTRCYCSVLSLVVGTLHRRYTNSLGFETLLEFFDRSTHVTRFTKQSKREAEVAPVTASAVALRARVLKYQSRTPRVPAVCDVALQPPSGDVLYGVGRVTRKLRSVRKVGYVRSRHLVKTKSK
jgi:hypothetical protein